MVGKLLRCLLLAAVLQVSMAEPANATSLYRQGIHRGDVDVSRYPWSAIGKLYNEAGAACSGVVIARDRILTAAHCLFNYRTRRFIPAASLHFLAGYQKGRYTAHVRIARYEIGAGFDPSRYRETFNADWAILTATEPLPQGVAQLRLDDGSLASGTRAAIAGYPQDRAHAMTADLDCELSGIVGDGRLFQHTCRGIKGYSGAPILIGAGSDEVRVAGIQIASYRGDGAVRMVAVPAKSIAKQARAFDPRGVVASRFSVVPPAATASADELALSAVFDEDLAAERAAPPLHGAFEIALMSAP